MLKLENKLFDVLRGYGSVAIAFSGGVDSTLLAAAGGRCLPEGKLLLVNIRSPFAAEHETDFATVWAHDNNLPLRIIELNPLDNQTIRDNPEDRCYHCKKLIMAAILEAAGQNQLAVVADGTNLDDFDDYRPGLRAAEELGIKRPFVESGFTKQDIRNLARRYGLPNWNAPAAACLASRIPYKTPLKQEDLSKIDIAESFLRALGFTGCRIRMVDGDARIEVRETDFGKAFSCRGAIVERLRETGFKEILLDLRGYRRGALNESIKKA